jgi:hypothetical protein
MLASVIQELSALLALVERADGLDALPASVDSALLVRLVRAGANLAKMPLVRNGPERVQTGRTGG